MLQTVTKFPFLIPCTCTEDALDVTIGLLEECRGLEQHVCEFEDVRNMFKSSFSPSTERDFLSPRILFAAVRFTLPGSKKEPCTRLA